MIFDRLLCAVLLTLGVACIGTEVLGVHEFMWSKYQAWNYLVIGSMLVTAATAALPGFEDYQGGGPLTLGGVLTAAFEELTAK